MRSDRFTKSVILVWNLASIMETFSKSVVAAAAAAVVVVVDFLKLSPCLIP